jgi:L-lactate dehydrogenase complex protein LldG
VSLPFAALLERELARSQTAWRVFSSEREARAWTEELTRRTTAGDAVPVDEEGERAIGVTWARALIAETGSAVLPGDDAAPRRDSLLVRHHLILVRAQDIYRDLAAYLATLPAQRLHQMLGSHLTLITGPSRTADVEKVLVVPAHGPAKVTIGIVR